MGWVAVIALAWTAPAPGVEAPLYERPPHDLVVLNRSEDSAELELLPLEDRSPRGALPRSGELTGRLASSPTDEIAIPYASIDRIVLFEQRLLERAKEHAAKKEFGSAYDYFARLDRDYPRLEGFDEAFSAALYSEARELFRAGETDYALSLLETLHERSRGRFEGLGRAVDAIGDALLRKLWEAEDYVGVRNVVDTLETRFRGLRLTLGERWIGKMEQGAEQLRDRAARLAEAGKTREALQVLSGAQALDPKSIENQRLIESLGATERTLWVGVWEAAAADAVANLDTPAARRQSRLTGGRLATLDAYFPAGAEYGATWGRVEVDDARRRLTLRFSDGLAADAPYLLTRALLAADGADGPLRTLRERAAAVSVVNGRDVEVTLREPHLQPSALAASALPASVAGIAPGEWRRTAPLAGSNATVRYERVAGSGGFDAIEEFVFTDVDAAVNALRSRQIHLLAGAPPWRLSVLGATPGVSTATLRLPTMHCLVMHEQTPLRRRRELRRALCYALAREETLATAILGGEQRTGFELLSAPFPRGLSLSDPIRYAYNDSVDPRPYEPRLAALLLTAARNEDLSEEDSDATNDVPASVTLAHPPTPVARVAVAAIRDQLESIGLGVLLREAPEQRLASGAVDYDLRYAEVTMSEPLVDASRLLGPGGVSGGCSPAMLAGIDRVAAARTGAEASSALKDLHRIAYADLPLIPLWQTVEHIVYLNDLKGFGDSPVDLYQTVNKWRIGGTP